MYVPRLHFVWAAGVCVCVYMVSVLITTISCPGTPHCLYTNRSLGDGVWLSFRPRLCIFLGTTPSTSSITEGSFLSQLALFCTEVAAVVMFASGVIRSSLLLLLVVPSFSLSLCPWDWEFKWRMCVAKLRILIRGICAPHSFSHFTNNIVTKMRNIPSTHGMKNCGCRSTTTVIILDYSPLFLAFKFRLRVQRNSDYVLPLPFPFQCAELYNSGTVALCLLTELVSTNGEFPNYSVATRNRIKYPNPLLKGSKTKLGAKRH